MRKYINKLLLSSLIAPMFIFAELPKEILADKYLIEATEDLDSKKYLNAIKKFKKIEHLEIEMPENFYFFYAKTTFQIDNFEKTKHNIERYLNIAGREGKFYKESLKLLIALEKNLSEEIIKFKEDKKFNKIKRYKKKIILKEQYVNDILIVRENYLNGKLDGTQETFYNTGEQKSICQFANGLPIENMRFYFPNQQYEKERVFKDYINGVYTDIYKNSSSLISKKEKYSKNKLIETEKNEYFKDGTLEVQEINNTQIPLIKKVIYDKDGKQLFFQEIIKGKEEVFNDKKEKIKEVFYKGFNKIKEITYIPNTKYQKVILFNDKEKFISETEYTNNKKHGRETIFGNLNKRKEINIYENGIKLKTQLFSSNNIIQKEISYLDGNIIETFYDKEGNLLNGKRVVDTGHIKEDFVLKEGKKEGKYSKYNKYKKEEETYYKNGKKNGVSKIFIDMKLREIKHYEDNKFIERHPDNKKYFMNGKIQEEKAMKKDKYGDFIETKRYNVKGELEYITMRYKIKDKIIEKEVSIKSINEKIKKETEKAISKKIELKKKKVQKKVKPKKVIKKEIIKPIKIKKEVKNEIKKTEKKIK